MCIINILDVNRLMHIEDINFIFEKTKKRKGVRSNLIYSCAKALSPRQGHCQHRVRFLASFINQ